MAAPRVVDPNSARPANKAPDTDERTVFDRAVRRADGQHLQREPRSLNIWRYIAGGLLVMFIIAGVGAFFYFDNERSAKEEVVRVCDSQQRELQNKVEGCKANLSETHGVVHELNLVKVAASGTIDCLQNEVEDCETRLSEKQIECDRLRGDYTRTWQEKEQLNQKNEAQTETIEAKTKEIDNLEEKLNKMQNERDHAIDNYGKEKQENEKCNSKLSSESKVVQDQKQTIHDLSFKLQAAEKRYDQMKEESGYGGIIAILIIGVIVFGLIYACFVSFAK